MNDKSKTKDARREKRKSHIADGGFQIADEKVKVKLEFAGVPQFGRAVHNVFGKVSFGEAKLEDNLKTYIKAVLDAKPSGAKGTYIQSITVTTSMGPGIRLDVSDAQAAVK